jgi:hypothetical protein
MTESGRLAHAQQRAAQSCSGVAAHRMATRGPVCEAVRSQSPGAHTARRRGGATTRGGESSVAPHIGVDERRRERARQSHHRRKEGGAAKLGV